MRGVSASSVSVVHVWQLGVESSAGASDEEGQKLLSLRDETPLLALPDSVELLPSRAD